MEHVNNTKADGHETHTNSKNIHLECLINVDSSIACAKLKWKENLSKIYIKKRQQHSQTIHTESCGSKWIVGWRQIKEEEKKYQKSNIWKVGQKIKLYTTR